MSDDKPEFHRGGLILSPDTGSDSVPILFDPHCEQIFTAEQVRQMTGKRGGLGAEKESDGG